jgi:hypothetical protein
VASIRYKCICENIFVEGVLITKIVGRPIVSTKIDYVPALTFRAHCIACQ